MNAKKKKIFILTQIKFLKRQEVDLNRYEKRVFMKLSIYIHNIEQNKVSKSIKTTWVKYKKPRIMKSIEEKITLLFFFKKKTIPWPKMQKIGG